MINYVSKPKLHSQVHPSNRRGCNVVLTMYAYWYPRGRGDTPIFSFRISIFLGGFRKEDIFLGYEEILDIIFFYHYVIGLFFFRGGGGGGSFIYI